MNKIGIAKIEISTDGEKLKTDIEGNALDVLQLYEYITKTLSKAVPSESLKLVFFRGITRYEETENAKKEALNELENMLKDFLGL